MELQSKIIELNKEISSIAIALAEATVDEAKNNVNEEAQTDGHVYENFECPLNLDTCHINRSLLSSDSMNMNCQVCLLKCFMIARFRRYYHWLYYIFCFNLSYSTCQTIA
jgi:hypothetical protein